MLMGPGMFEEYEKNNYFNMFFYYEVIYKKKNPQELKAR